MGIGERTAFEIEDRRPVVRAASLMALTSESEAKKTTMAPPLPANSDERIYHLHQAKPEFVGSRGPGGEGKTSYKKLAFDSLSQQVKPNKQVAKTRASLLPHLNKSSGVSAFLATKL